MTTTPLAHGRSAEHTSPTQDGQQARTEPGLVQAVSEHPAPRRPLGQSSDKGHLTQESLMHL